MNKNHYQEVVDNLHLEIMHQYDSVRNFSKLFNHSEHNLCRVFGKKHDLSVGMFLRIMVDLGRLSIDRPEKTYNLSLREYLEINHSEVIKGIMNLHTS